MTTVVTNSFCPSKPIQLCSDISEKNIFMLFDFFGSEEKLSSLPYFV